MFKASALGLLALMMSSAFATMTDTDYQGTYVGCGHSEERSARKMVLHLVAVPTELHQLPKDQELIASFAWADAAGNFNNHEAAVGFEKVKFDDTGLLMTLEIAPHLQMGHFVSTLAVTVTNAGLSGVYSSNSMLPDGGVLSGTWTARKLGPNESMNARFVCH